MLEGIDQSDSGFQNIWKITNKRKLLSASNTNLIRKLIEKAREINPELYIVPNFLKKTFSYTINKISIPKWLWESSEYGDITLIETRCTDWIFST